MIFQISNGFELDTDLGFAEMFLNDVNVEKEIRTIKVVFSFVSKVAEVSEVEISRDKKKWVKTKP